MVKFLLGQKSGNTKYSCFICLWDSPARDDYCVKKGWPARDCMGIVKAKVMNKPLHVIEKIIISSLHNKLCLIKQFVKSLTVTGDCFNYICITFPALIMENLKVGIFNGPQIRRLIKDPRFVQTMTETKSTAWQSFVLAHRISVKTAKLKIIQSW